MFSRVAAVAVTLGVHAHAKVCDRDGMCVGVPNEYEVGGRTLPAVRLQEDLSGWGDVSDSKFVQVPSQAEGSLIYRPLHILESETPIEYKCPSDGAKCDALVYIFECSPCETEVGGLVEYLVADGWQRTRCAPQFTTGNGKHPMVAYREPVLPGTTKTIAAFGAVEWAVFAIHREMGRECGVYHTPERCRAQGDFCKWTGHCELNTCVTPGPSQQSGCQSCPVAGEPRIRRTRAEVEET